MKIQEQQLGVQVRKGLKMTLGIREAFLAQEIIIRVINWLVSIFCLISRVMEQENMCLMRTKIVHVITLL